MKKNWLIMLAVAMMGSFVVACSSDNNTDEVLTPPTNNTQTTQGKQVVLTGSFGARSSALDASRGTRAVDSQGKVTWADGDKFSVGYKKNDGTYAKAEGVVTLIMDADGAKHEARFSCTLSDPDFTEDLRFIYPYSVATADGRGYETSGLLNNQKGTIADISANWDIAMKDVKAHLVGEELRAETEETIHLENQLCICEMSLKLNGSKAKGTKLTISDGHESGDHNYTITPTTKTDKFFVALIPVENKNFEFKVSTDMYDLKYESFNNKTLADVDVSNTDFLGKFVDADRKLYSRIGDAEPVEFYRNSTGSTLAKNKYYKFDLSVHNKGVVSPIGVIAWLGTDTELNCGQGHGLVMGLADAATELAWATIGGGYEDFEDFYTNGNVESISDCQNKYKNGATYTESLLSAHANHSHLAFTVAKAYVDAAIPGSENWFVPSAAQWLAVLGTNGIGGFGGTWSWNDYSAASTGVYTNIMNVCTSVYPISYDRNYCTSTQANDENAVYVSFSSTEGVKVFPQEKYKSAGNSVRPFFAF